MPARRQGQGGRAGEPAKPAADEPREGYTALGRILRAHGLMGEVRVMSFNPEAPNIQPGRDVQAGARVLRIEAVRQARDQWIVAFAGVETRDAADELRGLLIEVPDESIEPEEGAYFIHDLLGLRVWTDSGEDLGEITDVLQPGGNDVYVVNGPNGEVLIPVVSDVVQEIDVAGGRVVITPLAGLLNGSL